MSLRDVIVDTNVFAHAQNPQEPRFAESVALVSAIRASSCKLAVDPGFDIKDTNRSQIGQEYIERLRFGSPAFAIVEFLFRSKRILQTTRRVSAVTNSRVRQLIADRTDRVFVKVTINSVDHVLVSHDFHDGFQAARRPHVEATLSIRILDAGGCAALLR